MATSYKTPGVYVEEISKLPPSVAQVETAIPAFIGYTEKADDFSPNDLMYKPRRISSLVEYEFYYGYGPSPNVTEVNIDSNNNFVSAKVNNKFFTYDALRMFYANGGGDCYIVSIGICEKSAEVNKGAFTKGMSELEKEDAPTVLLFPDAVALSDSDLAAVQQAALKQSNDLQDRVGLFDIKQNDAIGTTFRNNIGINNLKYGMAYTPWLKVNLPKVIKFNDIEKVIKRAGISVSLLGLTIDTDIQSHIGEVGNAYEDKVSIHKSTKVLNEPNGVLSDGFNVWITSFNKDNNNKDLKNIFDYIYKIGKQVDEFVNGGALLALSLPDFKKDVSNAIKSNFDPVFAKVVALDKEVKDKISAYNVSDYAAMITETSWPSSYAADKTDNISETNAIEVRIAAKNLLQPLFDEINTDYLELIVNASSAYTKTLDDSLALSFPVYKSILTGVSNSMTVMPPSGAIAGVYAQVDRMRGVWKAPANVSLNNVLGPDAIFTTSQLENLNVDTVAGKSINAIRYFTGKGTLVFGARTLAGNDNEWRYISVRRFFNMVEESTKKSTEPFVFEPNDANTWVKIQGMIENFLTVLWRQGALQGAKPEHAFYVAVGLGKTMTPLDILEGRLIVEIGMAVVRPAEFIILRFSHKMAES